MLPLSTRIATLAVLTIGLPVVAAGAASAQGDGEIIRRGTCSNGATWKIKAKPDDGRIEIEAEIDTNRAGQTWTWVLRHDGSVSARGSGTTTARSGSFQVRRRTVNAPGTDTFRFRATRNGAVCVARVRF